MYAKFEKLMTQMGSPEGESINLNVTNLNVILGVLFFSVVKADGRIRPEETMLYNHLIENFLEIGEDERLLFEDAVEERMRSGEQFCDLIGMLKNLPLERKRDVLQFMADISISDRELHEVELNLITEVGRLFELE